MCRSGQHFFLEISSQPLVSLFVVTGDELKDSIDKKELHLRYKAEPSSYLTITTSNTNPYITGYERYNLVRGTGAPLMDLDRHTSMFKSVCSHINQMIMKNHGVVCYEDGNKLNNTTSNVFYIHICDAMNLIVRNLQNEVPD